jgi:hypothetical protein
MTSEICNMVEVVTVSVKLCFVRPYPLLPLLICQVVTQDMARKYLYLCFFLGVGGG